MKEGQHPARERAERVDSYRPPALVQLGTASELPFERQAAAGPSSLRKEEAWLRDLLDACQRALTDLRKAGNSNVRSAISDLEHVREKVERHLSGLAAQDAASRTR